MIKIYDSAKLPYSICKGSVKERKQLAEHLLCKFLTKLKPEIKNGIITTGRVKENIKSVLPVKNIMLDVISNIDDESCTGYLKTTADRKKIIQNYIMALKTNSKGKINHSGYQTLIHEAWHFFEFICNPKMQIRFAHINNFEEMEVFYEKHLYNHLNIVSENNLRKMIRKLLKKYSNQEKIDIIQQWRYNLVSEENAFLAEMKYGRGYEFKNMFYEKKINLLEDYLKKIISEERRGTN